MKLTSRLTVLLLGLGVTAALPAQDVKVNVPATTAQPAAAAPQYTEDQMLETYGWVVGKKMGLAELSFTPAQVAAFERGLTLASSGKDAPVDPQKIAPAAQAFLEHKAQVYEAKQKDESLSKSAAFFATLKGNKNIIELSDGLRYEIVQPGAGAYPKPDQIVKVNYTGKLIDGTVFDSSEKHGGQPVEFKLNEVIPGWTEGIQKINKGGKIRLYIPSDLAYGDRPAGSIPPSSTLIFDVELVDIKDAPPPTASATDPIPAK